MDESRPLPAFRCEQIEGGRLAKEWQEWKGSLQCYFDSYEITDQKLMRAKMLHLGGPQLQKVFRSLDGTEDFPEELVEKPWYDAAIEKLDAYFKPRRQDVLERHKLRNMKQAPSERFAHFVLRLRQQMQDCGFEKYRPKVRRIIEEMLMIDVIVEGCASQDLRRKILAKDQTLAEIEAMGESIESVLMQEKELGKGNDSGRSAYSEVCKITKDKGSRRQAHFENRSKDEEHCPWTCFACGRRGHKAMDKECPANGRNCNKCNAIGHFGLRCPKSKRSFKQEIPEQPSKKIRSVEASDNRSEEMDIKKVYYTFYGGNTTNVVEVNIGGVSTEMLVDSGSDANLITSKTWQKLKFRQVELLSCRKGGNKILRSYASEVPLVILGTFQAVVMVGELSTEAEFFVVENGQRDLIGDFTSKRLGILKVGLDVQSVQGGSTETMPFSSIKGAKVHIQMDPDVKPVFQPLRRIPIALEDAVNKKLDDLLRRDIIEVKTGPATWVSPLVVANKANGEIRLCVDLRRVNQAVVRERHPMPVVEDVVAKIGRGRIWSVLDIKDAFFLLKLDEESRDIVTFITHRGLYRFTRLTFGLVSAPEVFQRHMDEMLADCEGAYWYLDDVGIVGDTVEEHDARLNKV